MPPSQSVPRMERYARSMVRHRLAVLAAIVMVTGLLASQLGHVHLEIRRRAKWPAWHPHVQVQTRITDLFGGEGAVLVGVAAREGSVYTPAILGKLHRITQGLLATPGIVATSASHDGPRGRRLVRGHAQRPWRRGPHRENPRPRVPAERVPGSRQRARSRLGISSVRTGNPGGTSSGGTMRSGGRSTGFPCSSVNV